MSLAHQLLPLLRHALGGVAEEGAEAAATAAAGDADADDDDEDKVRVMPFRDVCTLLASCSHWRSAELHLLQSPLLRIEGGLALNDDEAFHTVRASHGVPLNGKWCGSRRLFANLFFLTDSYHGNRAGTMRFRCKAMACFRCVSTLSCLIDLSDRLAGAR
jgi:hypothetical protein